MKNMCYRLTRAFLLLLFCGSTVCTVRAQKDTVNTFNNGNLLLLKAGRYEWQEGGRTVATWDKLLTKYSLLNKPHWLLQVTENGKNKYGLLNMRDGILVLPPVYDNLLNKNNETGLLLLGINGRKALYSMKYERKTEMIYTGWREHINGHWLLFDSAGADVYTTALERKARINDIGQANKAFNNGREAFLVVKYRGGEGFLDQNNKLYYHDSWKEVLYIHRGCVVMTNNGKTGVYDFAKNKQVVPCEYDNDFFMAEMNRLLLRKDSMYALFDTTGKLYTRFMAEGVFNHNLMDAIFFRRGGNDNPLWGLMNNKGKVLFAPAWLSVETESVAVFSALDKDRKVARYRFVYAPGSKDREIKSIAREPEIKPVSEPVIGPGNTIVEAAPTATREEEEKIYTVLEREPVFMKDGLNEAAFIREAMAAYLRKGGAPLSGTITFRLVLEKDGSVSKVEVVATTDKKLAVPSTDIIRQMNRWQPGEQNGRPVRCEKKVVLTWTASGKGG